MKPYFFLGVTMPALPFTDIFLLTMWRCHGFQVACGQIPNGILIPVCLISMSKKHFISKNNHDKIWF